MTTSPAVWPPHRRADPRSLLRVARDHDGAPSPSRRHRLSVLLASAALLAASSEIARATTCQDVCPGTGACTISSTIDVDPDSRIDCSGRDVTFTIYGNLRVTGGHLWFAARHVTVNAATTEGGGFIGRESAGGVQSVVQLDLSGNLDLYGKIRVNGNKGGGTIAVSAAGDIRIWEKGSDGIEADGTAAGADGGEIRVEAGGSIAISDPIHAAGAGSAETSGGTIEIVAGGDILSDQHGHISAEGFKGLGGLVSLTSLGGDVVIHEHIDVEGRGATGDGGQVEIRAADRVEIHDQMTARGGVNVGGGQAAGGHVNVVAGCGGVLIAANVLANGGQLGTESASGDVKVESRGTVTVAGGVTIDVRALESDGLGGSIDLRSEQDLVLASSSKLDARGGASGGGEGGSIVLDACSVSVASSATVDVTAASGGSVSIAATQAPPTTGAQPLYIATGALLKAKGATADQDGAIDLAPTTSKAGKCSNDGSRSCFLDLDCTVGCQTGDCLYANPDTDGLATQFDLTPEKYSDEKIAVCTGACVP
jgi:hypothetical protein